MPSPRTPAHNFFYTHVVPNHEAWLAQPTDIRLAMNAVLSLFHMADHFWHAYETTTPKLVYCTKKAHLFRKELAKQYDCFAVLRDVAEAHKHMRLNRKIRRLTASNQTDVGATGFGQAGFGTGPFSGGPSIVVELDDKTKHHLSYLAQEVMKLWLSMLP